MAKRTTICAGIDTGKGYGQYLPRISLRSSGLRALRFREQLPRPSLRANGSRECAPDDRLREAIHLSVREVTLDCFASRAMTWI